MSARPTSSVRESCEVAGKVAAAIGCNIGDPLLRVDRIYLTTDNQPVELAISHFLPEQYSYRVKLRRSVR